MQDPAHSTPMVSSEAKIKNEAGIHCRPSTHIVKTLQTYEGRLKVTNQEGDSSDLRSMLSLMMLALAHGTRITLEVEGPDEEAQLQELIALFEYEYDFPPQGD